MSGSDPHRPDIDKTRQYVAGPDRTVSIGSLTFTQGDVDIRFTHTGKVASFRVVLWNIQQSSWHEIVRGDDVEIRLGWKSGPSNRVTEGTVTGKDTRSRGADNKYIVHGRSVGAQAVRQQVTASWQDQTVTTIARDIAKRLGLGVGTLAPQPNTEMDADEVPAPKIDGYWQLRGAKRVRAGLDRLVRAATREAGEQFEWYIDNGRLSVHAKRHLPPEESRLTTADEITQLQPHDRALGHTNGITPLKMTAFATPLVAKDRRLTIAHTTGGKARKQGGTVPAKASPGGGDYGRATKDYRVARYAFETGTDIGHHRCRAIIVPDDAIYNYSTESSGGGS